MTTEKPAAVAEHHSSPDVDITDAEISRLADDSSRADNSQPVMHNEVDNERLVRIYVYIHWRYVALVVLLWRPALSASSLSSLASVTALR